MKIIGLTGGIGSGKTTVLKMFKELGCATYVADIEAKKLMNSNKKLMNQIKQLFGDKAYLDDKLNTAFIAEIVFNDKVKLIALNALVHPAVGEDFNNFANKSTSKIIIYELLNKITFPNIDNSNLLEEKIKKSLSFLKNKAKTLEDIFNNAKYIILDEVNFGDDDLKLIDENAKKIIAEFKNEIISLEKKYSFLKWEGSE